MQLPSVVPPGSGKGLACIEIARLTGAACSGVELSERHVRRANELRDENPQLRVAFEEGSFTALPEPVLAQRFTHVFSQVSFCHAHDELPKIMDQIRAVLAPGGVAIINDYLGCNTGREVSAQTRKWVYERLNFGTLLGHKAWRRVVEESGFEVLHYENLDAHMEQSYADRESRALELNFIAADGVPQASKYAAQLVESGLLSTLFELGLAHNPKRRRSWSDLWP